MRVITFEEGAGAIWLLIHNYGGMSFGGRVWEKNRTSREQNYSLFADFVSFCPVWNCRKKGRLAVITRNYVFLL